MHASLILTLLPAAVMIAISLFLTLLTTAYFLNIVQDYPRTPLITDLITNLITALMWVVWTFLVLFTGWVSASAWNNLESYLLFKETRPFWEEDFFSVLWGMRMTVVYALVGTAWAAFRWHQSGRPDPSDERDKLIREWVVWWPFNMLSLSWSKVMSIVVWSMAKLRR